MKILRKSIIAILAGIVLLLAPQAFARSQAQPKLDTSLLIITTSSGEHRFEVEMALNSEQRSMGLMFRAAPAPAEGMLFDFEVEETVMMWMKNTPASLDMIFISAEGRIVAVSENTKPFSENTISSRRPVRFVLEVAAGTVRRLAVKPGDRVRNVLLGDSL